MIKDVTVRIIAKNKICIVTNCGLYPSTNTKIISLGPLGYYIHKNIQCTKRFKVGNLDIILKSNIVYSCDKLGNMKEIEKNVKNIILNTSYSSCDWFYIK